MSAIVLTERAMQALRQFRIPLCAAIVNRVLPADADGDFLRQRREQQARYLAEIETRLYGLPIRRIPMLPEDIHGMASLQRIAGHLQTTGI